MKPTIVVIGLVVMSSSCALHQRPPGQPIAMVPASLIDPLPKPVVIPPDPVAALPNDIRSAIFSSTPRTLREGITTVFPYNPHKQPTVDCQTLRVTEIVLAPGETVRSNGVGAGDTERWDIQPVEERVLVKPKEPGIATDLIVVTDKRSYHFTLRTRTPYMPQVAFYYPDDVKLAEAERQTALREAAMPRVNPPRSKPLNFNYRISGPEVAWRPLAAFDDGEHTYIEFPDNTMSADMPTLMVQNGNEAALVNYQVRGSYYIADRLVQNAALTSGTGTGREVVKITAEDQH